MKNIEWIIRDIKNLYYGKINEKALNKSIRKKLKQDILLNKKIDLKEKLKYLTKLIVLVKDIKQYCIQNDENLDDLDFYQDVIDRLFLQNLNHEVEKIKLKQKYKNAKPFDISIQYIDNPVIYLNKKNAGFLFLQGNSNWKSGKLCDLDLKGLTNFIFNNYTVISSLSENFIENLTKSIENVKIEIKKNIVTIEGKQKCAEESSNMRLYLSLDKTLDDLDRKHNVLDNIEKIFNLIKKLKSDIDTVKENYFVSVYYNIPVIYMNKQSLFYNILKKLYMDIGNPNTNEFYPLEFAFNKFEDFYEPWDNNKFMPFLLGDICKFLCDRDNQRIILKNKARYKTNIIKFINILETKSRDMHAIRWLSSYVDLLKGFKQELSFDNYNFNYGSSLSPLGYKSSSSSFHLGNVSKRLCFDEKNVEIGLDLSKVKIPDKFKDIKDVKIVIIKNKRVTINFREDKNNKTWLFAFSDLDENTITVTSSFYEKTKKMGIDVFWKIHEAVGHIRNKDDDNEEYAKKISDPVDFYRAVLLQDISWKGNDYGYIEDYLKKNDIVISAETFNGFFLNKEKMYEQKKLDKEMYDFMNFKIKTSFFKYIALCKNAGNNKKISITGKLDKKLMEILKQSHLREFIEYNFNIDFNHLDKSNLKNKIKSVIIESALKIVTLDGLENKEFIKLSA